MLHSELPEFVQEINKETDRGVILVSLSMIDQRLKQLLSTFLIEATVAQGILSRPVRSLQSRTLLAYSLGLLESIEMTTIDKMRELRNRAAHNWRAMEFRQPEISKLVSDLPDVGLDAAKRPREHFVMVAATIYVRLTNRIELIAKEKRKERDSNKDFMWKTASNVSLKADGTYEFE